VPELELSLASLLSASSATPVATKEEIEAEELAELRRGLAATIEADQRAFDVAAAEAEVARVAERPLSGRKRARLALEVLHFSSIVALLIVGGIPRLKVD
jgi:hypothetical protein